MKQEDKIKITQELLLSLKCGDCVSVDNEIVSLFREILEDLKFKCPMMVTEYITYPKDINGFYESFDICPRCNAPLSRTYQDYCSACGQHLKWMCPRKMKAQPSDKQE